MTEACVAVSIFSPHRPRPPPPSPTSILFHDYTRRRLAHPPQVSRTTFDDGGCRERENLVAAFVGSGGITKQKQKQKMRNQRGRGRASGISVCHNVLEGCWTLL